MSMSFIIGDVTFNHFDKVVSSRFLNYKITYSSFAIKKYFMLEYFETTLSVLFLFIFLHTSFNIY